MSFAVLWLFTNIFYAKFGGMASIGAAKASNPQKFSLQKSYFSPIRESYPLYGTINWEIFEVT